MFFLTLTLLTGDAWITMKARAAVMISRCAVAGTARWSGRVLVDSQLGLRLGRYQCQRFVLSVPALAFRRSYRLHHGGRLQPIGAAFLVRVEKEE